MIKSILKKGYAAIKQQDNDREKEKLGILRGGSGGCYIKETGKVYGTCPRKALLRLEGKERTDEFEDYLNFVAGFGHEHNLLKLLMKSPEVAKVEVWDKQDFFDISDKKLELHEDSIELAIGNNVISGRPDFVVTNKKGERILIEAKATVSEDKAENSTQFPFLYAVCQAALYQYMLGGVKTYIVYGNYSNYGEFKFGKTAFPKKDRLPNVEYREFPTGVYKKIPCAIYEYEISVDKNGKIYIIDERGKIYETPITVKGILDYYKLVIECRLSQVLPPKPEDIELYGKPKYSICKYCDENKNCTAYNNNVITYKEFIGGK